MATISFYAGGGAFQINNVSNSGLGFYGGGFGNSVAVGSYQDTTFITNGAGTTQGQQVNNIKFLSAPSGIVNSASSGIPLLSVPNYLATLNIRFTHSSAVKTQNAKGRVYDRSSINNPASGVTCKVAEVIHPNTIQVADGSGDSNWITPAGSAVIVDFVGSPGTSGISPNGLNTTDIQHDWFAAISASPDSIGSKTQFGWYFEVEYL